MAAALDGSVDLTFRWSGGDLDRLINARHAALHEIVARAFQRMTGWRYAAEVSFSIFGERGVIDGLAWHAARKALLVVELKSEIVDVSELLGTLDRKRRLAIRIANERGWTGTRVSVWLAIAASRTNWRRVAQHAALLRGAFPAGGRDLAAYVRDPVAGVAALTFVTDSHQPRLGHGLGPKKRVRVAPSTPVRLPACSVRPRARPPRGLEASDDRRNRA